jgi:hypothetical protein
MRRIEGSRPSPAIVVAVLALVAALAGTAVAGPDATTSKLTKSKVNKLIDKRFPVGTAGIADNAVTTPKIADNAVTTPKIADAAITDPKVADDSLTGAKINEATLGSPLVRNLEMAQDSTVSDSNSPKALTVDCPAGKQLVGGGANIRGAGLFPPSINAAITDSGPLEPFLGPTSTTSWRASAAEYAADADNWTLTVYAYCADL